MATGGSIIAMAWFAQVLTNKPLPPGINWLIVALTFLMAAFLGWRKERIQNRLHDTKTVRIEVLKLLAIEHHCTQKDIYEKTGATLDLLVQMHAAGELYLSSSGWVMREKPKNR